MELFGWMKGCTILLRKCNFNIHKNLVIIPWNWRLPFRKGRHWLFWYVPRIKWRPKPVSQKKKLWTSRYQLSLCGRSYIRGKTGMSLKAEAMEQLQVNPFLQSCYL